MSNRLSKTEVLAELSTRTGFDRKSISRVIECLGELAADELRKPEGEFTIPGMLRLKAIHKAATSDRPGLNPFTKQAITIKGKPASKKIRIAPIKAFKDGVDAVRDA